MALKNVCVFLILTVLAHIAQTTILDKALLKKINLNFKNENLKDPEINDSCRRRGICRYVTNYPDDLVTRLLKQLNARNVTNFTIEKIPEMGDDTPLCTHKQMIFVPRVAKDRNETWHYVLNPLSGRPFQGYQIEWCKKVGVCENAFVARSDSKIYCTQKIIYKPMVYLNIKRKKLDIKNFAVPNCCSCSLQRRNNY